MILKLSFLLFLFCINLFAVQVMISSKNISFEEKIDKSNVKMDEVTNINKFCVPLKLNDIEENNYITTHHINKNMVICMKDVKKADNDETIVFNFGGLKIEKKGKIIYENKDFIRIKNSDGSIEQIYKDGRLK